MEKFTNFFEWGAYGLNINTSLQIGKGYENSILISNEHANVNYNSNFSVYSKGTICNMGARNVIYIHKLMRQVVDNSHTL